MLSIKKNMRDIAYFKIREGEHHLV